MKDFDMTKIIILSTLIAVIGAVMGGLLYKTEIHPLIVIFGTLFTIHWQYVARCGLYR